MVIPVPAVGIINIQLCGDSLVNVNLLVAQERSLGFNLFISMNTFREVGEVMIMISVAVEFLGSNKQSIDCSVENQAPTILKKKRSKIVPQALLHPPMQSTPMRLD